MFIAMCMYAGVNMRACVGVFPLTTVSVCIVII